jgi:hypothetical protein
LFVCLFVCLLLLPLQRSKLNFASGLLIPRFWSPHSLESIIFGVSIHNNASQVRGSGRDVTSRHVFRFRESLLLLLLFFSKASVCVVARRKSRHTVLLFVFVFVAALLFTAPSSAEA